MSEVALAQIRDVAATADEPTRQSIKLSLRKLADSLERPDETIHRHGSLVSTLTWRVHADVLADASID